MISVTTSVIPKGHSEGARNASMITFSEHPARPLIYPGNKQQREIVTHQNAFGLYVFDLVF